MTLLASAHGTVSGMAPSTAKKICENRLRRMAQRQGLEIKKSRRRDPRAIDFGFYWVINPDTDEVAAGDPSGLTLGQVEAFLLGEGGPA